MLELPYCPEVEKTLRWRDFVLTEHLSPKISNMMRKSLKRQKNTVKKIIILL